MSLLQEVANIGHAYCLDHVVKQKIIDFLNTHHKRAWCMIEQNYDAWIIQAEDNAQNGWKHIELKSYETNDGQTKILDLEEKNT